MVSFSNARAFVALKVLEKHVRVRVSERLGASVSQSDPHNAIYWHICAWQDREGGSFRHHVLYGREMGKSSETTSLVGGARQGVSASTPHMAGKEGEFQ